MRRSVRNLGLVLAAILVAALAAVPAYASDLGQTLGPDTGMGNWQLICDQPLEFDLAYEGNNFGAQIQVASDPANSVGFNAYTDQQWQGLSVNPSITPIGRGTPNPDAGGNLTWQMGSPNAGLFHIQIYRTGATKPVKFWITLIGSGGSTLYAVSPLTGVAASAGTIILQGPVVVQGGVVIIPGTTKPTPAGKSWCWQGAQLVECQYRNFGW